MAATIKIKNSSTASAVPTSSDLVQGELAVNVTDKRIFTENASGTVVELGTNPSILTLPDGSASAPTLTNDGDTNTGIFFPAADTVGISTGGTERARVDASGNFGLGVTPSAWDSTYKALQVGARSMFYGIGSEANMANNAYYNAGYKYAASSAAGLYMIDANVHKWYNAASGTAGNSITFTQAMTLDASGRLGIGTTSPSSVLVLNTASGENTTTYALAGSAKAYVGVAAGSGQIIDGSAANDFCVRSGSNILFAAGGQYEKARIDSSGNLLVGTTTYRGRVTSEDAGSNTSNSPMGVNVTSASGSGACYVLTSYRLGTLVGSITNTSTATAYNTSSDYRLKENIAPMTGALATVAKLKPCTYSWKSTGEAGQGFIAHELQAVVPDAVTGEKDAVNEDGSIKPQGIDTSFLVATLTAALQELKAIVDAQAAEIAALKG